MQKAIEIIKKLNAKWKDKHSKKNEKMNLHKENRVKDQANKRQTFEKRESYEISTNKLEIWKEDDE